MDRCIVGLKDSEAQDLSVSGGKGASLASLHGVPDIPMPDGFVVTAQCFKEVVGASPQIPALLASLTKAAAQQTEVIRGLSLEIKAHIENIAFPVPLTDALEKTLATYGESFRYAVRSSATAEDLPGASFAGRQDPFLNIRGAADIGRHRRVRPDGGDFSLAYGAVNAVLRAAFRERQQGLLFIACGCARPFGRRADAGPHPGADLYSGRHAERLYVARLFNRRHADQGGHAVGRADLWADD